MKIFLFLLLLQITNIALSQETGYYGKVIDKETNLPVQGVLLISGNVPITFTDDKGIFYINGEIQDSLIELSHVSYTTLFVHPCKLSHDTAIIFFENNYNLLSEVSVVAEKTASLIKNAHKQFVKHYRPFSYWGKTNYKQITRLQGDCKSYLECDGYTFMPEVDKMVWKGSPCIVPLQVRRTREDSVLGKFCYTDNKKISLLFSPGIIGDNCGEFAFFERIHPLGIFNYNDYVFYPDSISDNPDEYVFLFKSKKEGFGASGWWIHNCEGEVWIDRQSLNVKKISIAFDRSIIRYNKMEVVYKTINDITYPVNIELTLLYNAHINTGHRGNIYVESELIFQDIDSTPRPNYMKTKEKPALNYSPESLIEDLGYNANYWSKRQLSPNWNKCLTTLTRGKPDHEFIRGAEQNIWDKTCWEYKYHTGKSKEYGYLFVQQMKIDLNLE